MATLTPAQVYALARGAGLNAASAMIATAVAGAESGYRTDAVGDVGLEDATWGPSVGLWQIRSLKAQTGTGGPRDASRLTDPQFNAASMASISGQGTNFGAWSTFTNGAYKSHIGEAASVTPGAGADGNPNYSGAGGYLQTFGLGGVASAFSGGWQTAAIKLVGAVAAAALVIVGAKQTVSST